MPALGIPQAPVTLSASAADELTGQVVEHRRLGLALAVACHSDSSGFPPAAARLIVRAIEKEADAFMNLSGVRLIPALRTLRELACTTDSRHVRSTSDGRVGFLLLRSRSPPR